jgi:RHS repeat-associated protein
LGKCSKITETSSGSITSTKQFVWSETHMREARDSSGSVTAQYFPLGAVSGGNSYYYTKNSLGSICDMSDGSGAVKAQYAYDPYGRSTEIQGNLASDFQYAGYYKHAPSGLNLALYRAYDSSKGRWLNRDPLGEEQLIATASPIPSAAINRRTGSLFKIIGSSNLYGYVDNAPANSVDPSGLFPIWEIIPLPMPLFPPPLFDLDQAWKDYQEYLHQCPKKTPYNGEYNNPKLRWIPPNLDYPPAYPPFEMNPPNNPYHYNYPWGPDGGYGGDPIIG